MKTGNSWLFWIFIGCCGICCSPSSPDSNVRPDATQSNSPASVDKDVIAVTPEPDVQSGVKVPSEPTVEFADVFSTFDLVNATLPERTKVTVSGRIAIVVPNNVASFSFDDAPPPLEQSLSLYAGGGIVDFLTVNLAEPIVPFPFTVEQNVVVRGTYERSRFSPEITLKNAVVISSEDPPADGLKTFTVSSQTVAAGKEIGEKIQEQLNDVDGLELKEWSFSGGLSHVPTYPWTLSVFGPAFGDEKTLPDAVIKALEEYPLRLQIKITGKIGTAAFNQLCSLQQLESLIIDQHFAFDELDLTALKNAKALTWIRFLECTPITDSHVQWVGMCSGVRGVTFGTYHNGKLQIGDEGIAGLAGLTHLKWLELKPPFGSEGVSDITITDKGLAVLARLPLISLSPKSPEINGSGLSEFDQHPYLQHLDLSGTGITDADIGQFPRLPQLTRLVLKEVQAGRSLRGRFPGMPKLYQLILDGTTVSDGDLEDLPTSLRWLSLCGTTSIEGTCERFRSLENLTSLYLNGSSTTDAIAETIPHLKKLSSLDLYNTKITDTTVRACAGHPSLKSLVLHETQTTDAGIAALAANPPPNLESLFLVGTKVTDESVDVLLTIPTLKEVIFSFVGTRSLFSASAAQRLENGLAQRKK